MGLARKESAQAGHFYVGVEHLFIALTRLEDGVTVSALEEQGIAPRFVRYMLRQELGQGDNRRFWPGFRETPRLHAVLQIARELAREQGRESPSERDLLLAILREGESIPCRVLAAMNVNLDQFEVQTTNWSGKKQTAPVRVPIELADPNLVLTEAQRFVIEQMFRGHERVVIERALHGGYTSAQVLVARSYRADRRANASVVVKLDERQAILYEKMRYDAFVRDTLPAATARVLDNPVVPDSSPLGGLKYTFIRDPDAPGPVDLADYGFEHGPEALAALLRNSLFRVFGETWWSQRHPYHFGVWQEYEMLLPPALVVEVVPGIDSAKRRLTPLGQWSRRGVFSTGEAVSLEGLFVADFYPDRLGMQLTSGFGPNAPNRAGKVEVRGIPQAQQKYQRGKVVDQIVGVVRSTRNQLLREQLLALQPDFDADLDWLPVHPAFPYQLPNPIKRYQNILQRRLEGSLSPIHGDLHLHNILVGPGGNAWLIDFAQTREGHTLFDWAVLETSLYTEFVERFLDGDDWGALWQLLALLYEVGQTLTLPDASTDLARSLAPIVAIRQIVRECLAHAEDWREYHIALALTTLRGLRWSKTVSVRGRRLLFLVSALAMALAASPEGPSASGQDMDTTDYNIDKTDIILGADLQAAMAQGLFESGTDQSRPTESTGQGHQPALEFSTCYSRTVSVAEWIPMHVYAYAPEARDAVIADAAGKGDEGAVGDSDAEARATPAGSPLSGLTIAAWPVLPGFKIEPEVSRVVMDDVWHRLTFQIKAAEVAPGASCEGTIAIFGNGVLLADMPLSVKVNAGGRGKALLGQPVTPYGRVGIVRAPKDTVLAERIEQLQAILGDGIIVDVVNWLERDSAETIGHLLDTVDAVQVCWSDHAIQSAPVRKALEYLAGSPGLLRSVRIVQLGDSAPALPDAMAGVPSVALRNLLL